MKIEWLFVDLDETVYPSSNGLWTHIGERINLYLLERMNFPVDKISEIRIQLFREYGTTLRGLVALYGIDQEDYLDFVHDIPLDDYIQPSPALRNMFSKYELKKYIFTNADRKHAQRVLTKLGILDCFEDIIDILDISPYCKPQVEAYQILMDKLGVIEPEGCVMVDDRLNNLETARQLNFSTIMVGDRDISHNTHKRIKQLEELPTVLPYK